MMRNHKHSLVLAVLVVGVLTVAVAPARAGVVVKVRPGHSVVKIKAGQHGPRRDGVRVSPGRVLSPITKHDRRVARRLASVTPYSKQRLLRLRQSGRSWHGIGRKLHIPVAAVAAAHGKLSWKFYVQNHPGRRDCGNERRLMPTQEFVLR